MGIMSKLKILVTTGIFPPSVGGPATYSKLLLDELPKHGIDVKILSFDGVRSLPKIVRHLVFFLKILVRSGDVSIIYAQDTVSVGLPSACAAKLLGKRFWLRVPGDYAWEQSRQRYGVEDSIDDFQTKKYSFAVERLRKIQRFVASRAQLIIVPSEYFRKLVSGWVKKPDKVLRIYNGVELVNIDRKISNKKTIFSSGRLVPWKGFDLLVDVVLELRQKYPDIELHIAGDGPDKVKLLNKIEEQKAADAVKLLGFISKDEIRKELSQASVFALNTGFESFSFAIVEAMWAGVPVVTTNVGNLKEIVDNGENGLLVSYNNKREFISAIEKILQDPEYTKQISQAGKEKAKDFSIGRTLDELVKILKNETNKY